MNLRDRIRFTALIIRLPLILLIIGTGFCTGHIAWAIAIALVWLRASAPLLRHVILPALFPTTMCAGCRRTVPLVARWKCGDHFTDHRERHILTFHCNQGHRLEGFNCPRCKSTILVQRGNHERLRRGSAVRLRIIARVSANGLLIGYDRRGHAVHLPWEFAAWHAAIFGGTGRGKSTLLLNIIAQLIRAQIGFTVLDCGDLVPAIRRLVPPEHRSDWLDIDVSDIDNPPALNLLSALTPIEQAVLAEELIEVFRRMYGSSWGPVLEHQLRMALRAAMSVRGSFADVYDLFTDPTKRARTIQRITDPAAKSFWVHEFPTIPAIRRSAVINKLAPLVFHPILGPIVRQRECVLDADDIIANRRNVIVNLRTGSPADDVTNVLGTFLVQKIVAAAFRQGSLPESQRAQHFLIIDEFPRFIHRASAFDQILAEARRYRLSLIVASQYVDQLDSATRAAIFGNVGALLAFRVGHRDARLLTHEFTDSAVDDLADLGVGRCLARIGNDWNTIRTLPPPPLRPDEPPSRRVLRSQSQPLEEDATDDEPTADETDEFVQ